MISIQIASPIRLYREGLRLLLAKGQDFEVACVSATRDELMASLSRMSPDLLLIDLALPEALEVVETLKRSHADLRIIALSVPDSEREELRCLEAGAHGFVSRDDSADDLLAVVRATAREELRCSARLAHALARRVCELSDREAPPARDDLVEAFDLTPRQREVLELVEQGLSNGEIAARLCIAESTVKGHVHAVLERLHVSRRGQAAALLRPE